MKITIDGKEIEAKEGQSVLEAALAANVFIPHLCSHPNHWARNIAACTNRNIWLKFVDNLLGTFAGCGKIPRSLCISTDIFHRQLSLKSSNFNGCELIPRLWY